MKTYVIALCFAGLLWASCEPKTCVDGVAKSKNEIVAAEYAFAAKAKNEGMEAALRFLLRPMR